MTQIRCAIYARCSTVNKGQHTDNQLLELREFAIRQGWEIVIEYTENISGKRSDRAQLMAMFAAASRRKFVCCCSGRWTGFPGEASWPLFNTSSASQAMG
jgi:DNA invertase Pin-like site-specific DNA recombinase